MLDGRVVEHFAQQSFEAENRISEVGDKLVLGGDADYAVAVTEGDARRRRAQTVIVGDGFDASGSGHRDIRRLVAEIDADHEH